MKSGWLKLVLINIAITLGMLFGLNFLINLVGFLIPAVGAIAGGDSPPDYDERADLPNYAANPAAATRHFQELETLGAEYRSFIGWSRPPFAGETITINEAGDRVHPQVSAAQGAGQNAEARVYFFGGSTIWGTGVEDGETIPAYFEAISKVPSANKGETAFVSRQSLNQFINLLTTTTPIDTVIFYEGVNDVQYHCQADIGPVAHARHTRFQNAIAASTQDVSDRARSQGTAFLNYLDTLFLKEIRTVAIALGDSFAPERETARIDSTLICDDDPELAEQVAQNLLLHWEIAHDLAQAKGINFIAVLQPVAYLDDSPVDHLTLDAELRQQYEAVYPLVQELVAAGDYPWVWNYTDIFPPDDYVYIDFCHLSANGNRFVAERLHQDLQRGQATPRP
ncbi:MAG TPA: hypothetical protein V6D02_00080 [Candidatus Obscuribacterales bacterium]